MSQPATLRQVFKGSKSGKNPTIFIVVPGLGTLPPEQWTDDQGNSWLRTAGKTATEDPLVLSFEHDLLQDSVLSQQRITEAGNSLLSAIRSLLEAEEHAASPIVLVAHSLGGVVLKRAICFAHRQQQRWEDLLRRVAGVILFSCPHSRDEGNHWQKVPKITKAFSRARRKDDLSSELVRFFVDDCKCFESEFSHEKPVLSVHEKSETSTGKMPWHKEILVGEAFAHPRVRDSMTLGMSCDHNHTCCLQADKNVLTVVTDFLERTLQKTRKDIHFSALLAYERSPALEQSTVASQSDFNTERSIAPRRRSAHLSRASASSNPSPAGKSARLPDTLPSTISSINPGGPSLSGAPAAKNDPQVPCFAMPYYDNPNFHGRETLLGHVADALLPPNNSAPDESSPGLRSFALSGPGGLGKSQVAAKFVHRHKAAFDAIFWVHGDSVGKIRRSFGHFAVLLGLVEENSTDAQDSVLTRDLVLGWLARPLKSYRYRENETVPEASWLVVFDNADDLDILEEFWPRGSTGSVLITSRVHLQPLRFFSNGQGVIIPPFDPEETAAFLLSVTKRSNSDEDRACVRDVAERLGHIPLAVAQMAGSIVRRNITFAEFLEEYENPELRAVLIRQPVSNRGAPDYEHNLLSVWGLEKLQHGAALLDVLAFMDPDGIPENILQENPVSLEMEGYPQSHATYVEARTELHNSSLIDRDRSAKKLVIHRLIQDTVRASMTKVRSSQVFVSALQLISGVWPYEQEFGFIKDETYRWRQCNKLYPHVMFLLKLSADMDPPTRFTKAHVQPPKLVLEAAWLSVIRADYVDTLPLIRMAERLCIPIALDEDGISKHVGGAKEEFEEQQRLFSFHRAAFAHHTNQPTMSLYNSQHFIDSLRKQVGDVENETLGVAFNELGVSFLQNGNATKSEECLRRSIEIIESLPESTANTRSMPLINLGFALWVQGRLDEAADVFGRTLAEREAVYGKDDTKSFALGKLLLGYGDVRAAQDRQEESLELHVRCLQQYKATVGAHHHRTGDGYMHVAEHYVRLKRYTEALELLNHASKIFDAPLSRDYFRPENARVCYKRWRVLRHLGRDAEGQDDAVKALKLYRAVHPNDSRGLENLSGLDFDKSITFWSR